MRSNMLIAAALGTAAFVPLSMSAYAASFSTTFSGFQEIGGLGAGETGAILSKGTGTLELQLKKKASTVTFKLTYSGLSSPVTQAHIHFGKEHVAGGIMVFFCSNLASPPPGTQACPANGGTVSGTITPASVIGPTAQNVTVGDFNALVAALFSNTAYANIHTVNFPAGEIRGQIQRGGERGDGRDDE
jgi:CHRD domain